LPALAERKETILEELIVLTGHHSASHTHIMNLKVMAESYTAILLLTGFFMGMSSIAKKGFTRLISWMFVGTSR